MSNFSELNDYVCLILWSKWIFQVFWNIRAADIILWGSVRGLGWVMSEMRYSNLRCFPRTWCESSPHLTSSSHLPSTCQWSNLSSEKARFISKQQLGSCSIWYSRCGGQAGPGGRKYNPSCSPSSSSQHPYQRVGSVERRRLPLVAAVQWRIVSLSNQRPVLDLPFSPSLQTLSRLYDASYATNAEENALRSEWIGETYAVRLVSPPLHCFIGREWGRMKKAASHDCGTIQN